jgi:hypothetical protein
MGIPKDSKVVEDVITPEEYKKQKKLYEMKVKCQGCHWRGKFKELLCVSSEDVYRCPRCGSIGLEW